jgi:hypothetical protein
MRCIICHNDFVGFISWPCAPSAGNELIAYHKINGLTTMKKHVDVNHFSQ